MGKTLPIPGIYETLIGILVSLLASALDALGFNLQRKSHLKNDLLPPEQQKMELFRPMWVVGFILYIGSQAIGSNMALMFLHPGLVAALGGMALIFNFLFARMLVQAKINWNHIIGTILIMTGIILVVIFDRDALANVEKETGKNPEKIFSAAMGRVGTVLYFVLLNVVIMAIYVMTRVARKKIRKSHYKGRMSKRTIGIAYCMTSAMISSQSVLFSEIFVGLLDSAIRGTNIFVKPAIYVVFPVLIISVVTQILLINAALRRVDTMTTLPIGFSIYSSLAFLNTLFWYNYWSYYKWYAYVFIAKGICISIAGVYVLTRLPKAEYMLLPGHESNVDSETSRTVTPEMFAGGIELPTEGFEDEDIDDEDIDQQFHDLSPDSGAKVIVQ